jgi:hypothetical protein
MNFGQQVGLQRAAVTARLAQFDPAYSGVSIVPATNQAIPLDASSTPAIDHLYQPIEGFFAARYRTAVAGMANSGAGWMERSGYALLAAGTAIPAVLDMAGEGLVNSLEQAHVGGQLVARATMAATTDDRIIAGLGATAQFSAAFVGLGGPLAGAPKISMPAVGLDSFPGAASTAAARETYVIGVPDTAVELDPTGIRYSQSTISYFKQRPGIQSYTIDDIILDMKQNGWAKGPIDVVQMGDGALTSLDNTRVLAAREAGILAKANLRDAADLLPDEMGRRFPNPDVPGEFATTWGEAVQYRIMRQSNTFIQQNPRGALSNPAITYRVQDWFQLSGAH